MRKIKGVFLGIIMILGIRYMLTNPDIFTVFPENTTQIAQDTAKEVSINALSSLLEGLLKILNSTGIINDKESTEVSQIKSNDNSKPIVSSSDYSLEVHYINVGQGDSTLLISNNHAMLIDGGNDNNGTALQLYLTKMGIGKEVTLDYVVATHADSDHVAALDVIITKFDCGTILLPTTDKSTKTYDDVLKAVSYKAYSPIYPKAGDEYSLGSSNIKIISPLSSYEEENDKSIGLIVTNGNNKYLFLGDATENVENDLLNNNIDINSNVYKVSHHGSKTSSSDAFLDKVSPDYAVISCGENNEYHHPHATVLNRLRQRGVEVFRTDEQGTIISYSDGNNITWNMSPSESWLPGN